MYEKQLTELKEKLSTELLKRGFHSEITLTEVPKGKNTSEHIRITSTNFQTTPVLFKELRLGGRIVKTNQKTDEFDNNIEAFSGRISVEYRHFDLGSNGCEVFRFSFNILPEIDDSIYSFRVG